MKQRGSELGKKYPKEFTAWKNLRQRCNNPNREHYERYGGRGISYCKRWESFENFFEDMGVAPTPKHSLDRIDNDGNYCPENCRWATQHEQLLNSSKSFDAKVHEAEVPTAHVGRTTIYRRIKKGWNKEDALNKKPIRNHKPIRCIETQEIFESIASAARKLKVSEARVRYVAKHPDTTAKNLHFELVML